MRLGAFIITFNRPAMLRQTILSMLEQTRTLDHILIVDNGNTEETRLVVQEFPTAPISYHAMSENLGPAGAIAYAIQYLINEGYDWIYWGDDDDPPQFPNTIERLLTIISRFDVTEIGAVGAVGARWDWKAGQLRRLPDEILSGIIDVDMIGGSGQLILNCAIVKSVGLPNHQFFFGLDDLEYCLRLRNAGCRLLVDGDLMRAYRTKAGRLQLKQRRSLFPNQPYNSIWRQYYSTRNYIFAMRQTFQRPDLARKEAVKSIYRAILSWVAGPKYGVQFTMLQLQGIRDGYLGHMGRTVAPQPKSNL